MLDSSAVADKELFDQLRNNRRLIDYLKRQLDKEVKILVVNPSIDQLRIAQGRAQAYSGLLEKLGDPR